MLLAYLCQAQWRGKDGTRPCAKYPKVPLFRTHGLSGPTHSDGPLRALHALLRHWLIG